MDPYFAQFATMAIAHFVCVIAPGPDFAIVLRQSLKYGQRTGLWTSVGVGLGILFHTLYTLVGIGLLIAQSVTAFNVMKFLGAIYLVYIGIRALRAKPEKVADTTIQRTGAPSVRSAILTGFLTNALNPKATLFFLSLFSVVINPHTPMLVQAGYGIWMTIVTALWFAIVSLFFSNERVKNQFSRVGHWIERTLGVVFISLGVKLALFTSR